MPAMRRYAELLVTVGIEHGLLGPREAGRIWDRHLLNCVVVEEVIPAGARVIDVGTGAGLPGLVLAIARPDLRVVLLDAQERRVTFLQECVAELDLAGVDIRQGRAEEPATREAIGTADVVVARALAPLDRLAQWCLPFARIGGRLLAIKGASASDEALRHHDAICRYGANRVTVRRCGAGRIDPPTTVVEIERGNPARRGDRASRGGRRR
jgi:16S rRNA (guanine527-N7)-methyltransferase